MSQLLTSHVFISYSRRDDEAMRRIVAYLRGQGIKVWLDNERLVPGTPVWEEEIEKAISGSSAVIVILSPDAKKSVWVRREISFAEQYHKRIFPIMVAGDEDSSIPLRLITNQYVDARKNETVGLQSLRTAVSFYLEEISLTENKSQSSEAVAQESKEHSSFPVISLPKPIRDILERINGLQLKTKLESYFQTASTGHSEEPLLKRFLLFVFWFSLFLVGPPFILALFRPHIQNVVMLFWITVFIFGVIGMYRSWSREALVASSAILGIAFNHLLRKYVPLVNSLYDGDVSLFWTRAITLEIFVYFGYKLGNWTLRKDRKFAPKNLQDKGLGSLAGAINGYLIIGSLLYYNHIADYPFFDVIIKTTDANLLYSINSMMIYMPPFLLGEPAIYFAVVLVIMLILIIMI